MLSRRYWILSLPWLAWLIGNFFYMHQYFLRVSLMSMKAMFIDRFSLNASMLGHLAAAFFCGYLVGQLISGTLIHRFGVRLCLTGAALTCALGSLIATYAPSLHWFMAGRVILGLGAAFTLVGTTTLVAQWFKPRWFPMLNGITSAFGGLGAFLAGSPLILLLKHEDWHIVMLVGSGVFILLALAAFYLTRDRQQKNVIDQHHTSRSTRHTVLAVLKQFNLWKVYIFALCLYAPIPVLATLWIDPFLMTEFHRSAAETLFSGSLIFVGALFGAPIIGAIASQTGHVKRVALSFSILSFICCIITLYVPMNMGLIDVALFLLGFGTASATLASSLAASIATREQTPIALSFAITSLNASGAVLLPFIGFMIDLLWHAHHNTPEYSSYNLHVGLMVLPILMLVGLLVGATITAPKPD